MISTHILDLNSGQPASGVNVVLKKFTADNWTEVSTIKTNNDGRINFDCPAETGTYQLEFAIDGYLQDAFFTTAPITFKITDTKRKYHVPLLLSPFGYSTYRGS